MNFIEWCNCNQGFWAFLLSLFSFLLSAIAIIYSIINYINENKKKLSVNCSILIDGSKENNLIVHVANVGNKPLGIGHVNIKYDNCYLSCKCNTIHCPKIIMPAETFTLKYDLEYKYIKECCKNNHYNQINNHFEIYLVDSFGNKHKCKKIYPAL